jgi:hypothetical protein
MDLQEVRKAKEIHFLGYKKSSEGSEDNISSPMRLRGEEKEIDNG